VVPSCSLADLLFVWEKLPIWADVGDLIGLFPGLKRGGGAASTRLLPSAICGNGKTVLSATARETFAFFSTVNEGMVSHENERPGGARGANRVWSLEISGAAGGFIEGRSSAGETN